MLKVQPIEYHAAVRARALGVEYTEELKTEIVRTIRRISRRRKPDPNDLMTRKLYDSYQGRTKDREVWLVRSDMESRVFKVVYDPRGKTIVTFLRE